MANTQSEKKKFQALLGEYTLDKVLAKVLAKECKVRSKPGEEYKNFTGKIDGRQTDDKKALMRSLKNLAKATERTELDILSKSETKPEELECAISAVLYGRAGGLADKLYYQTMGMFAAKNFEDEKEIQTKLEAAGRVCPAIADRIQDRIDEYKVTYTDMEEAAVEELMSGFVWWVNNVPGRYMLSEGPSMETVSLSAVIEFAKWMDTPVPRAKCDAMHRKLTEAGWGVRANPDWGVSWSEIKK